MAEPQRPQYATSLCFQRPGSLRAFRRETRFLANTNGVDMSWRENRVDESWAELGDLYFKRGSSVRDWKEWYQIDRQYSYLSRFTELLARHHEVAAATMDRQGKNIWVAFTSPHNKTAEQPVETREDNIIGTRCKLATGLIEDFPAITPARYYLNNVTGYSEDTGLRTNISFPQHATNVWSLLRQTRQAVSLADTQAANRRLEAYVTMSCVEQIRARILAGKRSTRRLFDRLEHDIEQTPWFRAHTECGKFDPLTKVQLDVLCGQEGKTIGILDFLEDRLPADKALFATARVQFTKEAGKDWYNVAGRRTFHAILRRLLHGFRAAVEDLTEFKIIAHERIGQLLGRNMPDSEWDEHIGPNAAHLQTLTTQVSNWAAICNSFCGIFHPMLKTHFDWLDEGFQASKLYPDGCDGQPGTAEASSGPGIADDIVGLPVELTDSLKEPDEAELDILDRTSHGDWGTSAVRYMDRLLFHKTAIVDLFRVWSPEKHRSWIHLAHILLKSRLRIIEIEPQVKQDKAEIPDDEDDEDDVGCYMSGYAKEDRTVIDGWLKKHRNFDYQAPWPTVSTSDEPYHCEGVLLSLAYLRSGQRQRWIDMDASEKDGVLLPDRDILESFPESIQVLAVSKLCCRACASPSDHWEGHRSSRFRFPGCQSAWTTCSFLPWTPHASGAMTVIAYKAVKARLELILDLAWKEEAQKCRS